MSNFTIFKTAVEKQFKMLTEHDLFRVEIDKDLLWSTYLESFPEGSNPIFRKRREYDCSCCRQFIRAVGDAVAIIDNRVVSIWDCVTGDPTYQVVADAMSKLVSGAPIANKFLHPERTAGTDHNFEDVRALDATVVRWSHFFATIPYGRNQGKNYYCEKVTIGPKLSEARAQHDVLLRSLRELTMDAIDTVLELIAQNSLYRGQEHKFVIETFRGLKQKFDTLPWSAKDPFVWASIEASPASVSKIRNTSIGTLLVDLSEGLDLEAAVRKFEAVVAPQNYKRPTALVTASMVAKAKETVAELGLTSALERRYATLADISVNHILFANRASRRVMKDDVFDNIATKGTDVKNLSKVEQVPIAKFISGIVPHVETIEVMVENRHVNNFVSLIAPVDKASKPLFKWDNGFSWSYNGDVTDSIKERVKKAGGNVTGDLCCRLAWHNFDDLDFHLQEPSGYEIHFANRGCRSPCGGDLDVDMNAGCGTTREPVENIFYRSRQTLREGVYSLGVHQFMKRENIDIGFAVEVDYMGDVLRFEHGASLRTKDKVLVLKFRYTHAGGIEVIESLPPSFASKEVWNVRTQEFHNVNVLMYSPNYWDGSVGNRHYMFMLDGCKNDGQARGFYNEFLRADLDKHRKVLEIVGSKMKTESSVDQLSGLGFSDTQHTEILVRVKGKITRMVRVLI